MTRKRFLTYALGTALALGVLSQAHAQYALPVLKVYKSPACGCCGGWVEHMRAAGFRVETQDVSDVAPYRRQLGVPEALASCHTAALGGYALEGHVPASDVKRMWFERTKAKGLAVPGMTPGSPGMQGGPQSYATFAFDERGSRIFERH